jgi:predicted amidohydrolase
VALAQIAPRLGEVDANLALCLDRVERAREAGADLVVFPELALTGYHLLDHVPEVALGLDSAEIAGLARASVGIDLVVGFVEDGPGHRLHNAAAYFADGRIVHVHRKVQLPTYGMFQEGRDFARGATLRAFAAPAGRTGLLICEDAWHPTHAWLLAQQGAEVLLVLSNGPARGSRPGEGLTSVEVWRSLLQVTSRFQTAWTVYVNRVGCEDGLTFGGGSIVVDPFGRVAAELPPLDEAFEVVELEAEVLRRARVAYPLLRDADLELVRGELERMHRQRFDLTDPGQET